ncbi:MAG: hypothetical protein Q8N12_06700 [Thermodesulfovibrionales bacterium]|nr:hypothetical protein [Thermodesulfovibrionales bacterium]
MKLKRSIDIKFLEALLDHAEESGTINPHFHKKDIMERLGIDELTFNLLQKRLGDQYCRFVDQHDGNDRYAINLSGCIALRDQQEQQRLNIRLAILLVILGAVLGGFITKCFS